MASVSWTVIKDALHAWVVAGSGLPADRVRWGAVNAPEPAGVIQAWITMRISNIRNPGSDWREFVTTPLVFADKTITTIDAGTNVVTIPTHNLNTGDGPVRLVTDNSLAGTGLAIATDYWFVRIDANTFKLAASFLDAMAAVPVVVDILGSGTGTHKLVDTAGTLKAGEELTEYVRGGRVVTVDITCFPPQPTTDTTEAVAILADVGMEAAKGAQGDAFADADIGIFSVGDPQSIDGVLNAVYFEPRATMTVVFSTKAEISSPETFIERVEVENEDTLTTFTVPET